MTETAKKATDKVMPRKDGRKAMLVYMKPDIIDALKEVAFKSDQKAWQFVEKAVLKDQAVIKALKAKNAKS
jgi:hypothetical protein